MSCYENPVLPGYNPDPSVCLVDGVFFAATSSFGFFPGIPIYISLDLVNWKQIGNVISREDQGIDLSKTGLNLPSNKDVHMSGLYAPTIRYHKGRFYCVCTNLIPEKSDTDFYPYNFICYTDDIWSGNWSKAHYIDDFYAIDPSLFWDIDDKCYLQGAFIYGYDKEIANSIHQFEVDPNTGKRLSEEYEICQGWSKIVSEGPHLYKKDDWYYLIFAEGGTFKDHMLCVARSKTVKGPFLPYEHNPIATNKHDLSQYVQWVGHGEIFQDQRGQYWALLLAGRNTLNTQHPLGRESFLSPVDWPYNGWPQVETIKVDMKISQSLPIPKSNVEDLVPKWFDHNLFAKYLFIRPKLSHYSYDYDNHKIIVQPNVNDFNSMTGPVSFIGKRQPNLISEFYTTITPNEPSERQKFGVCVYKDAARYFEFGFSASSTNNGEIYLAVKTIGDYNVQTKSIPLESSVGFKICSTEQEYRFYYTVDGQGQDQLFGTVDSAKISAAEFTGTLYGAYNMGESAVTVTEF